MADDKEVEKTVAEDLVVTKYKLAGQIVNREYWNIINIQVKTRGFVTKADVKALTFFAGRVIAMRTTCSRQESRDI